MTLTEYINQDPVKAQTMGSVILYPDEYSIMAKTKDFASIILHHFNIQYYLKIDEFKKWGNDTLYTTDEHGNPLRGSVFAVDYDTAKELLN